MCRTSRSCAVQHPFDRSRANERFDYYCCFKRGPVNRAVSRTRMRLAEGLIARDQLTEGTQWPNLYTLHLRRLMAT